MTYEEYIKELEKLKRRAENSFISSLPSIEKAAYKLASDFVDQNLDTEGGRIVPNDNALRALNKFTDDYLGAFTEAKPFQGAVAGYLKNFKGLSDLMQEFQKTQGLDIKQARLGAVQEIVVA